MDINAKDEYISYAMRNESARAHFLNYNPPSELLSPSFVLIEAMIYLCFIVAVCHAVVTAKRNNTLAPLLVFFCTAWYGFVCELMSYYLAVTGWNGEFSIMLFWNRMPLLQFCHYAFFYYTLFMIVSRLRPNTYVGAISLGFLATSTMAAWDYFAPAVGMYTWSSESKLNMSMIFNAPTASLQWLLWYPIALYFFLDRLVLANLQKGKNGKSVLWIFLSPVLVAFVIGPILMLPYNLFTMATWQVSPVYSKAFHITEVCVAAVVFLVFCKGKAKRDVLLPVPIYLWWSAFFIACVTTPSAFDLVGQTGKNPLGNPAGSLMIILVAGATSLICTSLLTVTKYRSIAEADA